MFNLIKNKLNEIRLIISEIKDIEEQLTFYSKYHYSNEELMDKEFLHGRCRELTYLHSEKNRLYKKFDEIAWYYKTFYIIKNIF